MRCTIHWMMIANEVSPIVICAYSCAVYQEQASSMIRALGTKPTGTGDYRAYYWLWPWLAQEMMKQMFCLGCSGWNRHFPPTWQLGCTAAYSMQGQNHVQCSKCIQTLVSAFNVEHLWFALRVSSSMIFWSHRWPGNLWMCSPDIMAGWLHWSFTKVGGDQVCLDGSWYSDWLIVCLAPWSSKSE